MHGNSLVHTQCTMLVLAATATYQLCKGHMMLTRGWEQRCRQCKQRKRQRSAVLGSYQSDRAHKLYSSKYLRRPKNPLHKHGTYRP